MTTKTLLDDVQREWPILQRIDLTQPFHALLHWPHQRIIAIAKYKDTVRLLKDYASLQPIYDVKSHFHKTFSLDEFIKILGSTNFTYNIKLEVRVSSIRELTERRQNITSAKKVEGYLDIEENQIILLRLKAAALDRIYDQLNYVRSSYESDIVFSDEIAFRRYLAAKEYQQSNIVSVPLKNYAVEINQDIDIAAKHLIFEYDEKTHVLELTQHQLFVAQQQVLSATTYQELELILIDYIKSNERAL